MVANVNPNWPNLFAEGNFGSNPFYTPGATQIFTDLTPRLQKSWSVRRGKQFELDQVQPGEFRGEWANRDGFLDPSNASSALSPNVLPYRGYRMRAQYAPTVNLLSLDQATGGEGVLGAGSTLSSVTGAYGTPTVTASATAWQGARVWDVSLAGGVTTGSSVVSFTSIPVQATTGLPYTFSCRIRSVTSGANPTVQPFLRWLNVTGGTVSTTTVSTIPLTGSPTATWTFAGVPDVVPAGAVAVTFGLNLTVAPGSAWHFQLDGAQFEQDSTSTTFVTPGSAYSLFSGMIERYPQSWGYAGTYGVVTPVAVDTMALLSQTLLKEAFVMDVVATSPTWFFQLNEPSGATTFSEQGGRLSGTASIFSASLGAGTLNPGSAINAASGTSGKFYGTNGPVVTVDNTANANQGTVIDLTTAGSTLPPTAGAWTRMIAFRTGQNTGGPPILANYSAGLDPGGAGYNGNMYFGLSAVSGGNWTVGASFYNAAGNQLGVATTPIINDNNWHLAFIQMSANGKTITAWVDAISGSVTGANDMHSTIAVNDNVGGDAYKLSGAANFGGSAPLHGDIALYAQWNSLLTAGQIAILTSSFKTAYLGERTDQRYSRILNWAGYQGSSQLDPGITTSMSYANDVANVDALTALQKVVDTEAGRHFVAGSGSIVFQSRQRYFQLGSLTVSGTPTYVFGEDTAGGEIPYEDLAFDFDPTRISNQIAVTQSYTGLAFSANDTTSQQNYGVRNLSRSSQSTNTEEVRESAFFLLSRYKDPHMRVQKLRVNAGGNPGVFPSVLAFEIGQYVQINRRDQFGVRPTIAMYGFIEQVTHTGDDEGRWFVDLEVSPAPTTPYATFTSLRTTLSTSASSGQPTITINALPDAATNPVRSQLTGGQIMTISGGGNSEIRTIATGGVQDQLAGYSTATVTFTANLTNTYPSGSAVMEATGANYDSLAVFDSCQFSY